MALRKYPLAAGLSAVSPGGDGLMDTGDLRVVSLFFTGLAAEDGKALVAQDSVSNLLITRRAAFVPFLSRYGCPRTLPYAVSQSSSHDRASAWFTSDDDASPGVPFTLDHRKLFRA